MVNNIQKFKDETYTMTREPGTNFKEEAKIFVAEISQLAVQAYHNTVALGLTVGNKLQNALQNLPSFGIGKSSTRVKRTNDDTDSK